MKLKATRWGKTYHKLSREPFDPTFINQYVIDEDSDFAGRVETINEDKLTLLDLSRERMMHRRAWDITPKTFIRPWHSMPCSTLTLIW